MKVKMDDQDDESGGLTRAILVRIALFAIAAIAYLLAFQPISH